MSQNTQTDTAIALASAAPAAPEAPAPVNSSEAAAVTAEKSAPVARFEFEGFNILENNDTATHLVDVGTIVDSEKTLKVIMLRARNLPPHVGFLVSKIETDGKKIWDYALDGEGNICLLVKALSEALIAHLEKGPQGKVLRVVPISHLGKHVNADIAKMISLKLAVGASLNRGHILTKPEQMVFQIKGDRFVAEQKARRDAEEAEANKRRQERITRVMMREPIEVWTATGQRRSGQPALYAEWPSLETGTQVVIVKSFDDSTGEYGEVVEAFKVGRERGKNPHKENPAPVSITKPSVKQIEEAAPATPVGKGLIEKGTAFFEVPIYSSKKVIDRAVAQGLNGGTYVVAGDTIKGDKAKVYIAQGGKAKEVGTLTFHRA